MRRSAADHDAANQSAAFVAGLIGAAKDADEVLLAPFVAVDIGVIAKGGAAVLDAVAEDATNRLVQGATFCRAQRSGWRLRMQTREEQRLIGVDVADASDIALVQQRGFDRRAATAQRLPQDLRRKRVGERFWTELRQRVLDLVGEIDGAEFAHIDESQLISAIQVEDGSGERLGCGGVGAKSKRSGHAQMHDQRLVAVELKEQILAPPLDARDHGIAQLRLDLIRRASAQ